MCVLVNPARIRREPERTELNLNLRESREHFVPEPECLALLRTWGRREEQGRHEGTNWENIIIDRLMDMSGGVMT